MKFLIFKSLIVFNKDYGQRKVTKLKFEFKNRGANVTDTVGKFYTPVIFVHTGIAQHCGITENNILFVTFLRVINLLN